MTACILFGMTVTTYFKPVPVVLKQISRCQRSCLNILVTGGAWEYIYWDLYDTGDQEFKDLF